MSNENLIKDLEECAKKESECSNLYCANLIRKAIEVIKDYDTQIVVRDKSNNANI